MFIAAEHRTIPAHFDWSSRASIVVIKPPSDWPPTKCGMEGWLAWTSDANAEASSICTSRLCLSNPGLQVAHRVEMHSTENIPGPESSIQDIGHAPPWALMYHGHVLLEHTQQCLDRQVWKELQQQYCVLLSQT